MEFVGLHNRIITKAKKVTVSSPVGIGLNIFAAKYSTQTMSIKKNSRFLL